MAPDPRSPVRRRLLQAGGAAALVQLLLLAWFGSLFSFEAAGRRIWAVADDIYISACYARNLAHGHGPVWYPGAAPVEGFSNPAWTLLLALFHRLPFFREQDLGLWVLAANAVCLAAIQILSLLVLARLLARSAVPAPRGALRWIAAAGLLASGLSLIFWLAEGFEVGLAAALALLGLLLALSPGGPARAAAIGGLAGLAFWTRMDGILGFAAAGLVLLLDPGWRPRARAIAACALTAAALASLQFAVRAAVYGEWLPNTYWLKLSHWPLGVRIAVGLRQDLPILPALAAAWAVLLVPAVRRAAGRAATALAGALAAFTLGILFSIHNGGDSWWLRLGFDRFGAQELPFLAIALAFVALVLPAAGARLALAALLLLALALSPAALDPGLRTFVRTLRGEFKVGERAYVACGLALEDCSLPPARILTGAAGAIVYFSHRGGSDFLGKCDPWVARQAVNSPQHTSGHNKRYAAELFRRDRPDFSREPPPPDLAPDYRACDLRGQRLWARRDSPNVLWERLRTLSD